MSDQSTPAKKKGLVSRAAKAIEDAMNTAGAAGAVNQMTGAGRNPLTEKRVVMGLHEEEDAQRR
jgi:hypothetical protein